MNHSRALILGVAVVLATAVSASHAQQPQTPQTPTFRSGVEVTTMDVTVVDADGRPIPNLTPQDFKVNVDGQDRRVVRADWVPLARPTGSAPIEAPPEGYSSNDTPTGGRLIVLAIDRPNLRPDGAMDMRNTVNGFVDRLEDSDRVAVIGLGQGGISTPFTSDRKFMKDTVARISGIMRPVSDMSQYNLSVSDAQIIAGSASGPSLLSIAELVALGPLEVAPGANTFDKIFRRECLGNGVPADMLPACREQLVGNAVTILTSVRNEAMDTLLALRALLNALKAINAPKTVVVVSEGFVMGDEQPAVVEIGSLAAAAQTSIYVLKVDSQLLDMSNSKGSLNMAGDRQMRADGVNLLASVAKGEVFNVLGNGASAMARVERELSGYYLVGVESEPSDKDGRAHPIGVKVTRGGAIVRARRELAHAAAAAAGMLSPTEQVAAALNLPLVTPGLAIRVATFALRDPKDSRVQLIIHADVGSNYTSGREVVIGYVISDTKGEIVVNKIGTGRLPTAVAGAPSPLTFSGGATLDPGDYTLKLAIAEGDRVGSVEHRVHAGLIDAGGFKLSELMIGGPIDARLVLAPTVGYDVRFGTVQGYIEAYGPNAGLLTMRYELAPGVDAPSIFGAVVPGRTEGDDRNVFSYAMPVQDLKPGEYFLRATLSANGNVVRKVARAFRVEPAPANTSALAAPVKSVALDVGSEFLTPRFRRETLSRRDTLQRFRSTLPPGAAAAFDEGTAALVLGDDAKAEAGFRKALDTGLAGADSTAPLAYLGATFAAGGKDAEALGIWQAALVDGAGFPQLYEWMTDALLRTGNLDAARPLLEEAVNKWPGETGFAKPLAAIYAKAGLAREAVALMGRYLSDHPQDLSALYSGVQWTYQVHQAGVLVRSKADDTQAARGWTDAYLAANGPDQDTIKRWMLAIEK